VNQFVHDVRAELRTLHHVPECVRAEVRDLVDRAILALRAGNYDAAQRWLAQAQVRRKRALVTS
jgi:hypothetical protein